MKEAISDINPGKSPTWFHYTMGVLAFIPILGVLVGLVLIIWGFHNRRTGGLRILSLGIAGICFTVLLLGGLTYHSKYLRDSGQLDDFFAGIAKKNLNTASMLIEQYRIKYGHYPSSLIDLETENIDSHVILDSYVAFRSEEGYEPYYYSLENNGNNYYLLSTGPDLLPFTEDDVVPDVSQQGKVRPGLLVKHNKTSNN
jgi:hypothetical protein